MNVLRLAALSIVSAFGLFAGCVEVERADCGSDSECRASVGLGSVCQDDGYCTQPEPPEACLSTFPSDLWSAPNLYGKTLVIGTVYDNNNAILLDAINVAVDEVRRRDGVSDGAVNYVAVHCLNADDRGLGSSDPATRAANAADYLTETLGAELVIAPTGSSDVQSIYDATADTGTVIFAPASAATTISRLQGDALTESSPGRLWFTLPDDLAMVERMGERIRQIMDEQSIVEPANVGVIVSNLIYSTRDFPVAIDLFDGSFDGVEGGQGINVSVYPTGCDSEASCQAQAAQSLDNALEADSDFIILYTEDPRQVRALLTELDERRMDTGTDPIEGRFVGLFASGFDLTPYAALSDAFNDIAPRVFGVRPATDESTQEYFAFENAASVLLSGGVRGRSQRFFPHAYDAAWMGITGYAWAAIRAGNSAEGFGASDVARGIRRIVQPGGEPLSVIPSRWDELQQGLSEGDTFNFHGASGPLDYDLTTQTLIDYYWSLWTLDVRLGEGCIEDSTGDGTGDLAFCPLDDVICLAPDEIETCGEPEEPEEPEVPEEPVSEPL